MGSSPSKTTENKTSNTQSATDSTSNSSTAFGTNTTGGNASFSNNGPWSGATDYINNLYGQVGNALGNISSGGSTAGLNATQVAGANAAISAGQQGAQSGSDLNSYANSVLNGSYLNASSNPYLQGAITAAIQPLRDTLVNQTLSGLDDAAQKAGAYGGSRNGIVDSLALKDFNTAATNTAANLAYQNYATERANQNNVGNTYSTALNLAGTGAGSIAAAGQQQQTQEQSAINNPITQLGQLGSILTSGGYTSNNAGNLSTGASSGTQNTNTASNSNTNSTTNSTDTTVSQPAQQGLVGQILSGALGAANLASMFANPATGLASGASGLAGSLGSLFGLNKQSTLATGYTGSDPDLATALAALTRGG